MEILINPKNLPESIKRTSITIGNFDGIHLGHQLLIRKVVSLAEYKNSMPALITFAPHPQKSLDLSKAPLLLTPLKKKIQILQGFSLKLMVIFDFNHSFSKQPPEIFIREYISRIIRAEDIVIGENFRFGRNGAGNVEMLKGFGLNYGFETHIMKSIMDEGEIISSTLIRKCIKAGDVIRACRLLGRYFSISGKVQKGKGIGSSLGFPTANIPLPEGIVPKKGVYITFCSTGSDYFPSITNIGTTPSVSNRPLTIEVHILNRDIDIYNEDIEIFFLERLRDENHYESIEKLKTAIGNDVNYANQFFQRGDFIYNDFC